MTNFPGSANKRVCVCRALETIVESYACAIFVMRPVLEASKLPSWHETEDGSPRGKKYCLKVEPFDIDTKLEQTKPKWKTPWGSVRKIAKSKSLRARPAGFDSALKTMKSTTTAEWTLEIAKVSEPRKASVCSQVQRVVLRDTFASFLPLRGPVLPV